MSSLGTSLGVLFLLNVHGCAVGDRLLADPTDYAQYRAVRVAPNFHDRLSAGWKYLRTQPEGRWRVEVAAWFRQAEARYLSRSWSRTAGLYEYLEVLPDGPHAAEVRARIFLLEEKARVAAIDENSFMRQERERQRHFEEAAKQRTEFRRTFAEWLAFLGGQRLHGTKPAEWSPAFRQRFFELEPPGVCQQLRCEKTDRFEFELPVATGLESQAAAFSTVLEQSEDGVTRVVVSGHGLFNSLAESVSLERVGHDDLQARAEAIGTAVQLVSAALQPVFPHDRCSSEALSPTVLARQCDGQRVEMIVAESFEQPDRIEFTPAPQDASTPPLQPAPGVAPGVTAAPTATSVAPDVDVAPPR